MNSPFSILVVDDEEAMRRTLAELLRLEGYAVITARDGDEAIRELQNKVREDSAEQFDLVLLDLKMPGRDGLDVLRFISLVFPDVRVILLTAHGSLQSAIEALRKGAHDYLLKPALPDQILESVRRGLEQRTEKRRRLALLQQLEASIQALRDPSLHTKLTSSSPFIEEPQIDSDVFVSLGPGVTVNIARREIYVGDSIILLTKTESKLFAIFLSNPGKVFSHRELVLKAQGYDVSDKDAPEILRPQISRLRKKLSSIPGGANWIVNIRSTGYLFRTEHHL